MSNDLICPELGAGPGPGEVMIFRRLIRRLGLGLGRSLMAAWCMDRIVQSEAHTSRSCTETACLVLDLVPQPRHTSNMVAVFVVHFDRHLWNLATSSSHCRPVLGDSGVRDP